MSEFNAMSSTLHLDITRIAVLTSVDNVEQRVRLIETLNKFIESTEDSE